MGAWESSDENGLCFKFWFLVQKRLEKVIDYVTFYFYYYGFIIRRSTLAKYSILNNNLWVEKRDFLVITNNPKTI